MAENNFVEYQKEYESLGIGDLLYELITTTVSRIVPKYPSEKYAPFYGIWDPGAIQEVTHSFIIDWLLLTGRLEFYLLSLDNSTALQKALTSEFRKYMANNRRRSEFSNLYKRTKRLLRDNDDFRSFGRIDRNYEIWGLAHWQGESLANHVDEVLEFMWKIELPPLIKYRVDSKKNSHLVSDSSLHELLYGTFTNLSKKVELSMLMNAIRYRLHLIEITEQSFEEVLSSEDGMQLSLEDIIPAPILPFEDSLAASQIAEHIYEILTNRQRKILYQYLSLPDGTLQAIAEELDISKSTVHNDLKAIERLIGTQVKGEDSENVFAKLSVMCQQDPTNGSDQVSVNRANEEESK